MLLTELQGFEKQRKIRDPRLDEMAPPPETAHIYYLYWNRFRGSGVTYQEIKAFEQIEGYNLLTWEVDLLFSLHAKVENTIADIIKIQRNTK